MGEGYWEGTGLVPGPLSNALRAGRREVPEVRLSEHHRGVGGGAASPLEGRLVRRAWPWYRLQNHRMS